MKIASWLFLAALLAFTAHGDEKTLLRIEPNSVIWSGRRVELGTDWAANDANTSWRIVAQHGRVIVQGTGAPVFEIPALEPGCFLDASFVRTVDGKEVTTFVRILSAQPLAGLPPVRLEAGSGNNAKLRSLGLAGAHDGLLITDDPGAAAKNADDAYLLILTGKNTRVPFPWDRSTASLAIEGECEKADLERWLEKGFMPPALRVKIDMKDGRKVWIFGAGFNTDKANDALELRKIIEQNTSKR